MEAKFVLSKNKVIEQYNLIKDLGLNVIYSYKTNKDVGRILEENSESEFSIHEVSEIKDFTNKEKLWFFPQAWNQKQITEIIEQKVNKFVFDNEKDLQELLKFLEDKDKKVTISLRMKFQERRLKTGKYFVYGMNSKKINKLILELSKNKNIKKLGIHIHRKSQNVSEWEIKEELKDSLDKKTIEIISFVNLGGGLPSEYRSSTKKILPYIFDKITEVKKWLEENNIQTHIEPGRCIAARTKLITEIVQIYDNNIIINTTIYNCALDNILTGTKMLVEGELDEEGNEYLIKGNSPTRDDIFRYNVKLDGKKVGDKITFLNAGAYNYTTDFFGYKKLKTQIEI
jgi:ornithine decarboxylase